MCNFQAKEQNILNKIIEENPPNLGKPIQESYRRPNRKGHKRDSLCLVVGQDRNKESAVTVAGLQAQY